MLNCVLLHICSLALFARPFHPPLRTKIKITSSAPLSYSEPFLYIQIYSLTGDLY